MIEQNPEGKNLRRRMRLEKAINMKRKQKQRKGTDKTVCRPFSLFLASLKTARVVLLWPFAIVNFEPPCNCTKTPQIMTVFTETSKPEEEAERQQHTLNVEKNHQCNSYPC